MAKRRTSKKKATRKTSSRSSKKAGTKKSRSKNGTANEDTLFDELENDGLTTIPLRLAAQSRYLNYSLSVITSRALPDVRDGMKPVQRRILYLSLIHI